MRRKYFNGDVRVENGDIVVDIGANVGEFTLAVVEAASFIIAVEPDDHPLRCLRRNTEAMSHVSVVAAAVSESDGDAQLYVSSAHNDSSFIRPESTTASITVRTVTLDTLIRDYNLPRIDFLKVEAEGYEPEILKSCGEAFQYVRKVAVDGGPERNGLPTANECATILLSAGFSVSVVGFMVYAIRPELETCETLNE